VTIVDIYGITVIDAVYKNTEYANYKY